MPNDKPSSLLCRLLTPPGTGGVAVVRLEGSDAWDLVRGCVKTSRQSGIPQNAPIGRLFYGEFHDDQEDIDDVLVVRLETRQDNSESVEISCHGGVRVVERILLTLTGKGAVLDSVDRAESDIGGANQVQREAFKLLAKATTKRSTLFLMAQANLLTEELKRILAISDEQGVPAALQELENLLTQSDGAVFLAEPAMIVVVGPVNAGKSMLTNVLSGRPTAVVTDRPGTTRDWVTADIAIRGVPATVLDTAGLRITSDHLETEAIGRGIDRTKTADLCLVVMDSSNPPSTEAIENIKSAVQLERRLVVWNKIDLLDETETPAIWPDTDQVRVSALTGQGIEELQDKIVRLLGIPDQCDDCPAVFCRTLHRQLGNLIADHELTQESMSRSLRLLVD